MPAMVPITIPAMAPPLNPPAVLPPALTPPEVVAAPAAAVPVGDTVTVPLVTRYGALNGVVRVCAPVAAAVGRDDVGTMGPGMLAMHCPS